MSYFSKLFASRPIPSPGDSGGETLPVRMSLEERMAFRRDMLFDTIAYSLEHKGIPLESYRLRVSRTDKRGHCFVVMVDLSNEFLHSTFGTHLVLGELGREIAGNAKASGFLEVVGVYWRVCDQLEGTGAFPAGAAIGLPVVVPAAPRDFDARIYASDLAPLNPA